MVGNRAAQFESPRSALSGKAVRYPHVRERELQGGSVRIMFTCQCCGSSMVAAKIDVVPIPRCGIRCHEVEMPENPCGNTSAGFALRTCILPLRKKARLHGVGLKSDRILFQDRMNTVNGLARTLTVLG
jgi:hypothetical protein